MSPDAFSPATGGLYQEGMGEMPQTTSRNHQGHWSLTGFPPVNTVKFVPRGLRPRLRSTRRSLWAGPGGRGWKEEVRKLGWFFIRDAESLPWWVWKLPSNHLIFLIWLKCDIFNCGVSTNTWSFFFYFTVQVFASFLTIVNVQFVRHC